MGPSAPAISETVARKITAPTLAQPKGSTNTKGSISAASETTSASSLR